MRTGRETPAVCISDVPRTFAVFYDERQAFHFTRADEDLIAECQPTAEIFVFKPVEEFFFDFVVVVPPPGHAFIPP